MSFNVITPNGSQPPKIFPAQNNTNYLRLQQIIQNDHQFNNTQPIPAPGNDGCHKQVTYINRADPSALAISTNFISFSKDASDNRADLWAYDGSLTYQYSWRELTGNCTMTAAGYSSILPTAPSQEYMPTNSYGTIYLLCQNPAGIPAVTMGYFITNDTIVSAFSVQGKWNNVDRDAPVVFPASPTNLVLLGKAIAGLTDFTYRIQFRKYA